MTLNHQAVVEHPLLGETQASALVAEHHAGNNSGSRRAKTTAERNGVLDVQRGANGEGLEAVASENVESSTGDEVVTCEQRHVFSTITLVGDLDILLDRRVIGVSVGGINGDFEFKEERKTETEHIEARANVSGRGGGRNGERLDSHYRYM